MASFQLSSSSILYSGLSLLAIASIIPGKCLSHQITAVTHLGNGNETRHLEKVCSETLEPDECLKCILADHSRDDNDTPELIYSLLFCLYSEATFAHVNADLLSQNAADLTLKRLLSECSASLFDAANFTANALFSMENKKYFHAWNLSKTARRSILRCPNIFRRASDLIIPSPVLNHMINAKRLYDSLHILFRQIVH